jgi:NADPH2:quinone reductase
LIMKAAVLRAFEGPLDVEEVDRPRADAGQVVVRVAASGVNPLDVKISLGQAAHAKPVLPAVLGLDLAGWIEEVGDAVTGFAVGDEVYGLTGGVGGIQGSLAQYAAVDARLIAFKPAGFSMREAAALPLVFITAWEGLVDRAGVKAGDTVLVHGGGGGTGQMAIQIALSRGASVFATGSAASRDRITRLGATAIDYAAESAAEYIEKYTGGEGFDVIFDAVGGATLDASFIAAKRWTGHVVSALGWGTHSLAPLSFRGATYSGIFTLQPLLKGEGREHHGDILRSATALADAGQLTVRLDDRHFTLATVKDAHRSVGEGTANGKVVVEIATV